MQALLLEGASSELELTSFWYWSNAACTCCRAFLLILGIFVSLSPVISDPLTSFPTPIGNPPGTWVVARVRPPSQSSPADGGRGRRGRPCVARGSWRRAWGWATIPPAGPRQAPTRERPYGSCRMAPLRFHPLRGRCLCGARDWWRRAWGWATIPPAGPRQAPTRDAPTVRVGWRPYGSCRMAPLRFVSDGAPTVSSPAGKMSMRRA